MSVGSQITLALYSSLTYRVCGRRGQALWFVVDEVPSVDRTIEAWRDS